MNRGLLPESNLWSPSLARHLDAVCNRFEAAWLGGQRPRLEEYVGDAPAAERSELLRELLALDVEYRSRTGATPTATEYGARFPEHAELIRALFREATPAGRGTAVPDQTKGTGSATPEAARIEEADTDADSGRRAAEAAYFHADQTTVGASGALKRTPLQDQLASTLAPRPQTVSVASGPGPTIPGYDILGVLGRGGMGIVYRARQVKLKRLVALKMILAGAEAEPHQLQRFRAEAEAVARLQHPHIVQIYEIGEQAGQPYLALEYVEGCSLVQKLNGTPLPPGEAAQLLETLARAMHYAHQQGIVHRDLKPANILLQIADCRLQIDRQEERPSGQSAISNPQSAIPKITDFGLAKQLDLDVHQTHSGAIVGTPSYMAPEQAEGKSKEIGPAADGYALGAILYEMLTGRSPFKGATVLDTLVQVRTQEPVPPSHIQPKVPHDLETICLKCLRKEPQRRYASAEALADDLRRFVRGEPIQARPTPAWERGLKWARRRKAATALIAVSALAFVGLVAAGFWYQAQRTRVAEQELRERVLVDESRARTQGFLRDGQAAALQGRWQDAVGEYDKALATITTQPLLTDLREDVERLRQEANGKLAFQQARALAARKQEELQSWRNEAFFHGIVFTGVDLPANLQATRNAAEKALALFGVSAERASPPVVDASFREDEKADITTRCYELLLLLAEVAAQQGKPEQVRQAVGILDRAANLGPTTKAYHLRRARYLTLLGKDGDAQRESAAAQALKPASALDYFLMGDEQQRQGKLENLRRAVGYFESAVDLEPGHFWAQFFLAAVYLKLQRPDLAKGPLRVCLFRQPPDFPWVYLMRGIAHAQLQDLPAAEQDFQQAEQHKPNAEARYNIALNRGTLRMLQKKYPEALAELNRAIGIKPRQYQAYQRAAEVYQRQNLDKEAADQLDKAIAVARAAGVEAPLVHEIYRQRSGLHERQGDRNAALQALEQAIALELPGSASLDLAEDQVERGRILLDLKKYADALTAYEIALKIAPKRARAHLGRGRALIKLENYREAVEALSKYVHYEEGKVEARVYLDRGLAQDWLGNHAAAIEDYTRALDRRRDARTLVHRGWAHLFQEALPLAAHDFDEAIQLDVKNGDAYNGRGYVLAKQGQWRRAVADARRALELAPEDARTSCNAARVFAQVVGHMAADPNLRGGQALEERSRYEKGALELLRKAVHLTPAAERPKFWRLIAPDPAWRPIRGSPEFDRLTREYSRPAL